MAKIDKITSLKLGDLLVWLICALYIGLFFSITVSNILLTVLILFCAANVKWREILLAISQSAFAKLVTGMFIIQIIGLLYSSNLKTGSFVLEKKISFLIIPIFLLPLLQRLNDEKLFQLKKNIGVITLLSSITLLVIAFFRYFALGYTNAFSFESFRNFEGFSSIHYVYYSMYFACGSLILIDCIFDKITQRKHGYWIIFGLFVYSLGIMILVASKTGIGAFIFTGALLAFHKTKNKRVFEIFFGLTCFALVVFLYFNETTRNRFTGMLDNLAVLKKDNLMDPVEFDDFNVRLVFWKIQISNLVKDNRVLTGVGTGDAQDYIDSLYILPQYQMYGYVGWESHNQWVFTLVQLGVVGVLLMALLYFNSFRSAIAQQNFSLLIFLTITFMFTLTESILESNKGIVFFMLFFAILTTRFDRGTSSNIALNV